MTKKTKKSEKEKDSKKPEIQETELQKENTNEVLEEKETKDIEVSDEIPPCETDIAQLEATIAELKDKHLRLFSEFDNYRKRTTKERIELFKTASSELIIELLSVLDDFERATKSFETSTDIEAVKHGVDLIYSKLSGILNKKGLESMDAQGNDFDTDYHEAITEIPAPTEDLKSKVVDVIEKGYLLNGKVIRFAKVVVGK